MTEKTAPTEHPVQELIARRWSPRAFADRPVDRTTLLSLFEATRWAASSYNEQPWSFLVATREDQTQYERMLGCLVPGNQGWARSAPVLMISVAGTKFERNQKPNRHAFHDVGLATANLVSEATARDLYVHMMAGIEVEKIRTQFSLPDGVEPVAGLALGYLGDPQSLEEKMREMENAPRERKPLSEIFFGGKFGAPSPLLGQ